MNELKRLTTFQKILRHYQPSEEARQLLAKLRLVLMVAPTGAGRNTIIKELVKTGHYHDVVTDTTRESRVNDGILEQNGHEYWFRSEADILQDLRAGAYLEAAIIHQQQVSGISIRELQKVYKLHKIGVMDIETKGVDSVVSVDPKVMVVFLVPPSFAVWQQRLKARGPMAKSELRRRLISACHEFEVALSRPYYHFIVNHTIPETIALIEELVTQPQSPGRNHGEVREKVEQLRSETEQFVKTLAA